MGASTDFEVGIVNQITSAEHLKAVLERSKTENFAVVLDFTASWCKPCQAIKPRFKAIAAEYSGHAFFEVDGDEHDDIVSDMGVMGLPTFQVFVGGEKMGHVTGGKETDMVDLIQKNLSAASTGTKKAAYVAII